MFIDHMHVQFPGQDRAWDLRYYTDEPSDLSGGDGGGGSASDQSLEDIAHATYSEAEASEVSEASEASEASTSAEVAGSAAQAEALLESVQGEAMRLDPDDLPEELRPFIKQFQADYTRKTQQLAESRKKAASELAADELAELRAQIARLEGTPAQGAPGAPDVKAFARSRVEAETGPLISHEEFFAANDNATVIRFLEQQTRLAAVEAVAQYHLEVADPALRGINTALTQRQQAEVRQQYDSFVQANPDLVPYEAEVAALYTAGKSLDEAAALVRKAVTADDAVTKALATGAQIGEQRAKQVASAKDNFSVPHSSTAGKGGPVYTPAMSFQEIAEAAAREAGVL